MQIENPGRARRPGSPRRRGVRSVDADVDGAIARAERCRDQPRHIAPTIDHADIAEAEANVVMMVAPATTPAPAGAKGLGRSCGRRQRGGAERGCGNKSKNKLAKHGHSPIDAPSALPGAGCSVTHRSVSRRFSPAGSGAPPENFLNEYSDVVEITRRLRSKQVCRHRVAAPRGCRPEPTVSLLRRRPGPSSAPRGRGFRRPAAANRPPQGPR